VAVAQERLPHAMLRAPLAVKRRSAPNNLNLSVKRQSLSRRAIPFPFRS
jgi:hypothetical protein